MTRERTPLTATLGDFLQRGQRAQRAVDALLKPPAADDPVYAGSDEHRALERGAALVGAEVRRELLLTPSMRICSVCGFQTDKGAGPEGNLCPLLSCPGDLR